MLFFVVYCRHMKITKQIKHILMKEVLSSIFFLVIAGGLLWGWNHWQKARTDASDTKPSVSMLSSESIAIAPNPPATDDSVSSSKVPDTQASPQTTPKETLDLKVYNSGAAKGSAAKVQTILKQNGYTKTAALSATGNYTGTVVYYTSDHQADATAVQQILLKDYPSASIKASSSPKTEDGSAEVVVMLGK